MRKLKFVVEHASTPINAQLRIQKLDTNYIDVTVAAVALATASEFILNTNLANLNSLLWRLYLGTQGFANVTANLTIKVYESDEAESFWVYIDTWDITLDNQNEASKDISALSFFIPQDNNNAPVITEAEKAAYKTLINRLKNGEHLTDNEMVLITLGGQTALTNLAINALDQGQGYDGLIALGIGDATAIRILSVYNVKTDTTKYNSEKGIELMMNDISKLNDFNTYAISQGWTMPPLTSYMARLRANPSIYAGLGTWYLAQP